MTRRPRGKRKGLGTYSETPPKAIRHQADPPFPTITDATDNAVFGHAVVVELPDDKVRRRIYLSLHSAERAVERALATGQRAEMYLCRIVPVGPNGGVR